MHKENTENNSVIYIVVGNKHDSIGRRVRNILSLRDHYNSMVLVSRGRALTDRDNIVINPWPNLTTLLKYLKLDSVKHHLDRYLYFPSPMILYVGRMRRGLERRIENDINSGKRVVIITSAPPHDICLAGLQIKKKFPMVKWIVDWRDLWSYDENYRQRIPRLYEQKLLSLEKDILNTCDMNVTTNSYAKRVLEKDYGINSQRILSINHSFNDKDRENYARLASPGRLDVNNNKIIKIGFSGTLVKPPRVPGDRLIEAIITVRKAGINVELHHYGPVPDCFIGKEKELANDGIVFHGNFPYEESLKELSACDFSILILADLPNSKAVMSLKITDYLLVNKPIIAIVPKPSVISELVEETGSGYIIPADSHWGEELVNLFNSISVSKKIPVRNESKIREYSWKYASGQWRSLIDGV